MDAEGAASNWSAVYLRSSLGAPAGADAAGYKCFAIAMTIGAICGDNLASRWGPTPATRLLRPGSARLGRRPDPQLRASPAAECQPDRRRRHHGEGLPDSALGRQRGGLRTFRDLAANRNQPTRARTGARTASLRSLSQPWPRSDDGSGETATRTAASELLRRRRSRPVRPSAPKPSQPHRAQRAEPPNHGTPPGFEILQIKPTYLLCNAIALASWTRSHLSLLLNSLRRDASGTPSP